MKVSGGNICGEKKQSDQFVRTGLARGSYPVHVCTIPVDDQGRHKGQHYDSVHRVHF